MKQLKILALVTLVFTGLQSATAQIEKGFVRMEITDVQTDNEQMQAMAGMFKGSFTEVYFNKEKAYTNLNMMNGMNVTQVLVDRKTDKSIMLMSIMGQKMQINMSEEELKEMQSGSPDADINYEHFRDETKDILGFTCHKVKIAGQNAGSADMTIWVTDKIKSDAHISNGIQMDALGGFPLEYVISVGGQLEMTMTATDFKKDFDEKVFNVDTAGYKVMTMDEFMQSMGGMGGF